MGVNITVEAIERGEVAVINLFKAYQVAERSEAPHSELASMRATITDAMITKGATSTQAELRFWRMLAEVRDNHM